MSDLLRYQVEFVVLPEICEHCYQHPAVYLWTGTWPYCFLCRVCVDPYIEARLQYVTGYQVEDSDV